MLMAILLWLLMDCQTEEEPIIGFEDELNGKF
jgi:hypothetical protein